jgi:hypothetical protein
MTQENITSHKTFMEKKRLDIILKMGQVKYLKPNSTQKNIKIYVILKATQMGLKF